MSLQASPKEWFTYKMNSNGEMTIIDFADSDADYDTRIRTGWRNKMPKTTTTVVFPSEIEGFPVREIHVPQPLVSKVMQPHVGVINNVVVPEGVKILGEYFMFCNISDYLNDDDYADEKLKSVVLPKSLRVIGSKAFNGCRKLTSIDLPEGLQEIGSDAFFKCGLTSITFPEGLKEIGSGAFQFCKNLTSVTLPASLEWIGSWAFRLCENLTEVKFAPGLTKLNGVTDCFQDTPIRSNLQFQKKLNDLQKAYDDAQNREWESENRRREEEERRKEEEEIRKSARLMEEGRLQASGGIKCPICGARLPKGSKFCNECGTKIQTSCPQCGASLPPGSKFCNECGAKL